MLRGLGFGRIWWFCVGGAVEEVTRQDLMLMSEGAAYKPPFINPPPPLALLSLNRRMLSLLRFGVGQVGSVKHSGGH